MEIIPRCEGREIHLLRRGYFLCFDIFLEPAVWLVWNSWFDQVLIKHWFDYIFLKYSVVKRSFAMADELCGAIHNSSYEKSYIM